jgi:hypothetical protein
MEAGKLHDTNEGKPKNKLLESGYAGNVADIFNDRIF